MTDHAEATDHADRHESAGLDESIEGCVRDCLDTHRICLETLRICLERGGEMARPELTRALMDCAAMSAASADFMLRGSALHPRACGLCAEACRLCAEACERYPDDEQLRACAEACRTSAASCGEMAMLMTA